MPAGIAHAVDAEHRRAARRQVEIGRLDLEHVLEQAARSRSRSVVIARPRAARGCSCGGLRCSMAASTSEPGMRVRASSELITCPAVTRSISAASIVCMPTFAPTCIADGIWWVLPSRIRLRTAGVPTRISSAAARPPPTFLQQHLRHHAEQRLGEHRADLRLLLGGEHVDDAVDRLRRARGVQRGRTRGGRSRRRSARARSSRDRAARRPG